jgi:peptidyl-prolyl cis-trans isomerase D
VSDNARRQAELKQVAGAQAQSEMAAYLEALKKKSKVEILKPALKDESRTPSDLK